MRQFKVIPTTDVVDKIYEKHVFKATEHDVGKSYYEDTKWEGKRFTGKLQADDVDLIRYLLLKRYKAKSITEYFKVNKTAVYRIKSEEIFSKHISPFEVVHRGIYKEVNQSLVKEFEILRKDDIDKFIKFYLYSIIN